MDGITSLSIKNSSNFSLILLQRLFSQSSYEPVPNLLERYSNEEKMSEKAQLLFFDKALASTRDFNQALKQVIITLY